MSISFNTLNASLIDQSSSNLFNPDMSSSVNFESFTNNSLPLLVFSRLIIASTAIEIDSCFAVGCDNEIVSIASFNSYLAKGDKTAYSFENSLFICSLVSSIFSFATILNNSFTYSPTFWYTSFIISTFLKPVQSSNIYSAKSFVFTTTV